MSSKFSTSYLVLSLVGAAAMTACGGGSSVTTPFVVSDPYATKCSVTVGGVQATETTTAGKYESPVALTVGALIATGCQDATTGVKLPTLSAAPGSKVVSPLTTLVKTLTDSGKTETEAKAAVISMLGLATDTDLTADPVADAKAGRAAAQATAVAVLLQKALGTSATASDVDTALANMVKAAASNTKPLVDSFAESGNSTVTAAANSLSTTANAIKSAVESSSTALGKVAGILQAVNNSSASVNDLATGIQTTIDSAKTLEMPAVIKDTTGATGATVA